MDSVSNSKPFDFGIEYIREHFGSNVPLATQQITHNLYRTNEERLVDQIVRELRLRGTESILDVGCGNGFILSEVVARLRDGGRATGIDVSPAMLELARSSVSRSVVPVDLIEGRAEDLSRFPEGHFERVMANFIFHYIDDPDQVCAELGRVVSKDGFVLVSIEARHSMPEMYNLHFEAMTRCDFPREFIDRLPRGRRGKMVLDNAQEILSRHFGEVTEHPYVDALEFKSAESFMRFYAAGHRYLGAKAMAGDVITPDHLDKLHLDVEEAIQSRIEKNGSFSLSKYNSIFVCREPGRRGN